MVRGNQSKLIAYGGGFQRVRYFDEPFGYLCLNGQVEKFCSYCLRRSNNPSNKLYKCASCQHAGYCNKDCQRLAWKNHRNECRRLKGVFPNLPLTEVLFISRIIDRVLFLEQNGDKYGWEKDRKWSTLIGHNDDIRDDEVKYAHFEKLYDKMCTFRKAEMIEKEKFFDIFCKIAINSHSVHSSAGDEIGLALDLGVSEYNHSCRPNCSLVFNGFRACLRALTPETNVADTRTAFISYIDVGCSRYRRRKDLKMKWYFDCECVRCHDPHDDILTSIKCLNANCDEALVIFEDSVPEEMTCSKCGQVIDIDHIKNCQELMLSLPVRFDVQTDAKDIEAKLEQASKVLHSKNVYVTRLKAALFHVTGTLEDNLPFIHKNIFDNYRLCFPRADRHVAYQLLKIVKAHIERDERDKAVSYAYEAMSILEVCLGLDHPYYLQTLALWTYLNQNIPKTNDELFALMNFRSNRPVDIVKLIAKNP